MLISVLNSCSKQEFSEATNSIKKADSLFMKANDGLKTLDSISKRVNDSNGIARKVVLPEIEKQSKKIDSTLKSGSWKIDSINKDIAEITKNIKVGTEVASTLDSANQALQKGENVISVLSKTADKILNQTRAKTQPQNIPKEESNPKMQNNPVIAPPVIEKSPIVKTAVLEIEVADINQAKAILKQKIRENNADLVSENFSQKEGFEREYLTAKVPLYNFDQLVSSLANELGAVKSKSTESEGIDYVSGQMCDLEITLVKKENLTSNQLVTDYTIGESDSFSAKFSSAFMSGFKILGDFMLVILPFWPVFIIAGLVFYFVRKSKKNKELKALENQFTNSAQQTEIRSPEENDEDSGEPDYSKYLPKK